MNESEPVSENELHAYVDGRLDGARRAAVEAYLAANAEAAERVAAYRRQNELLVAAFGPVAEEPLPARLRARWALRRYAPWWRAAGMAAGLSLAFLSGWWLRGEPPVEALAQAALARQAAVAHVVYAPEVLHPVEVRADQEEHLAKWLSKRLGQPLRAPKFGAAGFELVGGRLLPGADRPAAQFMYQDARGQRLTLYVSTDVDANRETAFRYAREDGVGVFYWVDGPLGYALSGELERERLLAVAESVYHELNH
jgi:anti-sigma factor RsiW